MQKWLADQMGVTPERPTTPGSSGGAAGQPAASSSKRPASTASSAGGLMEWMSKLTADDHVSVINRSTGKRLTGSDGPKLKYLPQWLMEHPLYEVKISFLDHYFYVIPLNFHFLIFISYLVIYFLCRLTPSGWKK